MSEQKLADHLAKAQAKIRNAKADKVNSFLKNKYADLASVYDACKEHLSEEGIAVVQVFETIESGSLFLKTSLLKGDESIDSRMPLDKFQMRDWHSMGSAITYARRYSLSAIVGIAPEDDDGSGAVGLKSKEKTPTPQTSKSLPTRKKQEKKSKKQEAFEILNKIEGAEDFVKAHSGDQDITDLSDQIADLVIKNGLEEMKSKVEKWQKAEAKKEEGS